MGVRTKGRSVSIEASERRVRLLQWIQSNWSALTAAVLLLIVLVLMIIWLMLPADKLIFPALPPDSTDSFENDLITNAKRSMGSFEVWYKTNILLQLILIATSLAAAMTAALTTSENANMLKKYSVILTAITAALATAQQTFHIRENINSFITSTTRLELLVYDYVSKRGTPDYSANPLKLQKEIMDTYVDIEANRMRAWASIGEQSSGVTSNQPSGAK
jgi:hypothetical protein